MLSNQLANGNIATCFHYTTSNVR